MLLVSLEPRTLSILTLSTCAVETRDGRVIAFLRGSHLLAGQFELLYRPFLFLRQFVDVLDECCGPGAIRAETFEPAVQYSVVRNRFRFRAQGFDTRIRTRCLRCRRLQLREPFGNASFGR